MCTNINQVETKIVHIPVGLTVDRTELLGWVLVFAFECSKYDLRERQKASSLH